MNLLVITQLLRTIIINSIQTVYNRLGANNINPCTIYISISTLLSCLVILFYYHFVSEKLNIDVFLWIVISSSALVWLLMSGFELYNKYFFLDGLRVIVQLISYKILLIFFVLSIFLYALKEIFMFPFSL
jgi:NADH:ubiquinone oxidoreductase subunit H